MYSPIFRRPIYTHRNGNINPTSYNSCITSMTLNSGNYGIALMGNAGCVSAPVWSLGWKHLGCGILNDPTIMGLRMGLGFWE